MADKQQKWQKYIKMMINQKTGKKRRKIWDKPKA